MTTAEALALLSFHSFTHEDIYHPQMEEGFLGMLRPFRGELYENNFHEMMNILWTLKDELKSPSVNRQIMSNLFNICHYSRTWGLDPGGMLQRNNLLSAAQIEELRNWTEQISYTIACLLEGAEQEAFSDYPIDPS